jgi:hypothetical protein
VGFGLDLLFAALEFGLSWLLAILRLGHPQKSKLFILWGWEML